MKVLIVDDEEHVREAIELSIDWEQYGIGERLTAGDGREALELLRLHKPAVLFCDMSMPRMDGAELLRLLREENGDTQVIVVSGHDDFQYTQATIRALGVDYLLKPFRKRELESALARALSAWHERMAGKRVVREGREEDEKRGEYDYRLQQADRLLEEQRLAAYLKGELPLHEGVRSLLGKLGAAEQGCWLALVLPRNRDAVINSRFDGDSELFAFAVQNIAQELLTLYGAHAFVRLDPYLWAVLLAGDARQQRKELCMRALGQVAEGWRQTLGLLAYIGFAEAVASPACLPAAATEARTALLQSQVPATLPPSGKGAASLPPLPLPPLPPSPRGSAVGAQVRLSDQQLLLEAAVASGNKMYAAELIAEFVQAIQAQGPLRLKELQAHTLEANLVLERVAQQHGGRELPDLSLPLWIGDIAEWERLLQQRMWRLMEDSGTERSGRHAVEAMRSYVQAHYQEDISLSSLSARFHFSPQYIAKRFKEVYNTTVVTYVTELRMEKARSLLQNTGLSVLEISGLLGYADENYFGKVFKKHAGVSPLQYRKQHQQKGAT